MKREKWQPTNHSYLCSAHFEEKFMYRTNDKRRLLAKAVPKIFSSPIHMQKKQKDRPLRKRSCQETARTSSAVPELTETLCNTSVVMDVIKTEPEVDPLSVQSCDVAVKEEASPSPDEGTLLDLTRIKEEFVDESYNLTSEIKYEEILFPNNFPVMKCETEEESCDLDAVKNELILEVTEEENEILSNSITENLEKTDSSEFNGIACDEDRLTHTSSYRLDGSITVEISHNSLKCNICNKVFVTPQTLKRHLLIHTFKKSLKCDVCGKGFSVLAYLIKHSRIHTGERPYKCNVCGKFFSRSGNLKQHGFIHTGERPYKCGECGKCFLRSDHLKQHGRSHAGKRNI
ncbi:uncharacterized protein [Periplaneta americana]